MAMLVITRWYIQKHTSISYISPWDQKLRYILEVYTNCEITSS